MDLQAVKICSNLKAIILYYKSKLCVHNFTMYNLASYVCTYYWWDETQTNLSASSFTNCIIVQLQIYYDKNPTTMSYFGVVDVSIKTRIEYYFRILH